MPEKTQKTWAKEEMGFIIVRTDSMYKLESTVSKTYMLSMVDLLSRQST